MLLWNKHFIFLWFCSVNFNILLKIPTTNFEWIFVLSPDIATAAVSANPLGLTGLGSLSAFSGLQAYPAGKTDFLHINVFLTVFLYFTSFLGFLRIPYFSSNCYCYFINAIISVQPNGFSPKNILMIVLFFLFLFPEIFL